MRGWKLIVVGALAAGLVPVSAGAAGYYLPDLGTVARSRGGAFCVAADDPTAIAYNPSGMIGQKSGLLVDITALRLSETFKRRASDVPADSTAPLSVSNAPPPQVVPEILYVHPINDRFSIGGGLHAPAGGRWAMKANGAQRYTLTSLFLAEAALGVAGSYRVAPRFDVGLELEAMVHSVTQKFVLTRTTTGSPSESPTNDSDGTLDVKDTFTPNFILGVRYGITDSIQVGASYRPGANVDAKGTLKTTGPDVSQNVDFKFAVPQIARVGVRYLQPGWDAEADFDYEGWSNHPNETVYPSKGTLIPSGATSAPKERDFTNAYSVRLGGSYVASPKLKVLGGLYYETSAVPSKTLDVGTWDSSKEGIGLGASWEASPTVTLSGNLMHTLMASRTVNDSVQRQQNGFNPPPDPNALSIISNGTYSGAVDFLGVSALIHF